MTTTWNDFWKTVGSEEWLAAKALLELSRAVGNDAARWLLDDVEHEDGPWQAWVDDVDANGRGWSSTEWRLFGIVASLTTGRPLDLSTLAYLGSWETAAWAVLVDWGTGGNNREYPGRARVVVAG
ncbi:hypothetical protein [Microlunatus parietis]|uniref:Uncharacterized protein n=1 Tax=Microlunatus parietis TaxID=682979 RepID=A0A7Y9LCJ3_9ACTN|nr:hypothetical protein [Microlunatus parietis]NYE71893.1 hypothetical protein [Microlunatus parietis]